MLFHSLQGTNVGVDIEQMVGQLAEEVDVAAMEEAWRRIAERHPILRTRFAWAGRDRPEQEVVDAVSVPVTVHDLRERPEAEQTASFDAFLAEDRLTAFQLDSAPLWRLSLFRLGPERETFVFTYHHSLLDTSVVWAVGEAFATYDALCDGTTVEYEERRPYRDHAIWLREHLEANRSAADEYFRTLLDGFEDPTRLTALESTTPDVTATIYGALRFALPGSTSAAFHALSAERRYNAAVIIEAAWALVLGAFSGTVDVVFGSTRGGRRSGLPGSDNVMGLFINTPPVRVSIDPLQTVGELLDAVRAQQGAKREHEHTALSDIQAAAGMRGGSLFDTIVVVNELHQGTRLKQLGGRFATREFDLHDQTNFPLTLLAYADPQFHCKLSYDRRVFDDAAMERLRELLVDVIDAIVTNPDQRVGELPRVPRSEQAAMRRWNDSTARPFPADLCIHQQFEGQVDERPDDIALVFRGQRLTYRELDERANAMAAHLRGLGVGPDSMVGVFVERSVEMMVGLLAILKAGAAYVPMDPAYPAVRISMMLEDSHADVVLTHSRLADSLTGIEHVIELDAFHATSTDRVAAEGLRSDHLAYVIFTSGSTGRPKGVMVEHRNVVNFFTAMDEALGHDATARPGVWLAVTSISFDISVLELFWTLTRGFTVVLQEDEGRLVTDRASAAGAARSTPSRTMDFSLFYFAADAGGRTTDRYRLLLEGAKFADQHGFAAVWTPERHFHEFGGLYPNPSVTSAAVAAVTERVQIRAGSVVLPLHNPIRCAEEWSVVDNLSNGRVGLSFASGWHANDFALAPDNYANRRELMAEGIRTIQALWRGESVTATSGDGREISVKMYPPAVQQSPPIWITAGGTPATFAAAGTMGASILTNLLVMSHDDLVANIATYRAAYKAAGHSGDGHISVMLHTFVGDDVAEVRSLVKEPFLDYLRTSTDLINKMQWEQTSFAKPGTAAGSAPQHSASSMPNLDDLDPDDIAVLMDHAFERYFGTAGLFGTPESCVAMVDRLRDLGVDEIACLIDFGVDEEKVLAALTQLDALRVASNAGAGEATVALPVADDADAAADWGLVAQIERHGVTHLQCTPSMAAVIAAEQSGVDALAPLDRLMLGGEALPAALVDRIRPELRGQLLNMYGPTETTIWSTVSPIRAAGEPITIGRPIANTQIYIVDRNLQQVPVGVAGELLIGGDGVVRGYLDRPELTAERFVNLPAAGGARTYRTGDLARLQTDGEIEFSGRLDHQVKIRGYRIELGEIESAIGRFPGIFENVVVARSDTPGDPRLIAYVVPTPVDESSSAEAWGTIWDETYAASAPEPDAEDPDAGDAAFDPTFDIAGWNDSYSGEPIAADEMREWVDITRQRVLELGPRRVLEIGCGTGLVLFGVAPHTDRYLGIDLAQSAIERIARHAAAIGLHQVEVRQGGAHDAARIAGDERFDTIVINSVAQYFPDVEYFLGVVHTALGLLEPGGSLFLGDLRSLPQLPLFAASVELARAPASMSVSDLAPRVQHRIEEDEELLVDPKMFAALAAQSRDVDGVRLRAKGGRADNEMTKFRYDAVVRKVGGVATPPFEVRTVELAEVTTAALAEVVGDRPDVVRITGLRNDRLVREERLVGLLSTMAEGTVADLRAAIAGGAPGVHPDDIAAPDGYDASAEVSLAMPDRFDVVLRSAGAAGSLLPLALEVEPLLLSSYANQPARRRADDLAPHLRAHLRSTLPDYMVPTAFVVLDAMPRTPNGKIDRSALPAPDRSRHEGAEEAPPAGEVEARIAAIWQDILQLDTVGVTTNLFDLGANSLMMVRASTRLGEALGRRVPLVDMFGHPSIRALAAHLDDGGDGEGDSGAALTQSQDRAQARRDAMQRRRTARPTRPR